MRFSWLDAPVSDAQLDAEFEYWKNHFLRSAVLAVCSALAGGLLIALWPPGVGSAEVRSFTRQLWPFFVELTFWFGFLVGLLWAASRRIGCALGGTAPWESAGAPASATFGQAACGLFFASCLLWAAMQFVRQLGQDAARLFYGLLQLVDTGFVAAAVCLLLALALRLASRGR